MDSGLSVQAVWAVLSFAAAHAVLSRSLTTGLAQGLRDTSPHQKACQSSCAFNRTTGFAVCSPQPYQV